MSTRPRGDRLALLSFVLIVPALVTFVVGLASSGTLPLYVSLVCSVVAGLALAVAARMRRSPGAGAGALLPVGAGDREDEEEDSFGSFMAPATVSIEDFSLEVEVPQIDIEVPPPAEPKRRRRKRPPAVALPPPTPPPPPTRQPAVTYDEDGVLVFPIEDYETLTASEVVRVLKLLDSEEIETVRDHEAAHDARPEVLERIDVLLARRGLV